MTREEAIARIENHKIAHKMNEPRAIYISEAIDMAIEALEQVPCDDAISRQATVQRLCKLADFMNEKRDGLGSPYVMAALFIQDNKDEFPCITPETKIGNGK